ncbi:hypothetical protein HD597_001853 [Nonomuraea thailandensis]|uniref:Uncharacterized protein n=1 Tax=Nonomuraea thailandensis TaxID=1188745 RepID=A0A9X2JZG7_9ACTN|nr:hypothetical protein [Nonomuraea thailandensis]
MSLTITGGRAAAPDPLTGPPRAAARGAAL